jgi:predicted dehydrogenase
LTIPARLEAGAPRSAPPSATGPGSQFTAMEIAPFTCLAREFATAIRDGKSREPSILDAVRTQEICEAIELAGKQRRWISLPLP